MPRPPSWLMQNCWQRNRWITRPSADPLQDDLATVTAASTGRTIEVARLVTVSCFTLPS
jgi:hypothetical protein